MTAESVLLSNVQWGVLEPEFAAHLSDPVRVLAKGRQADLLAVGEPPLYVVKVVAPPVDPARIFALVREIAGCVLVASPLAWGRDHKGRGVLVMPFAGTPLDVVDVEMTSRLAALLSAIHRCPVQTHLLSVDSTKEMLIERLIPADSPRDLVALASTTAHHIPALELGLTHGDFHPPNVVAMDDRLTVIDWIDARISDRRYDLAWAALLFRIYRSEELAEAFVAAYRRENPVSDLTPFDVLAALRWLYLAHTAPVPINREWLDRAGVILSTSLERLQRD